MQRSCQQNDTRFTNSAYMLLSFSKRNSFTIIFDPVENIMFQFRSHRWVVVERMLYIVPSSFSSIVDCCCAAFHILVENISFFFLFLFSFLNLDAIFNYFRDVSAGPSICEHA